jgi:D-alanyl-lipoteichoic acid biosynthesis protein DltD
MEMKQFLVMHLLPLIAGVLITINIAFHPSINNYFFKDNTSKQPIDSNYFFLEHFNHVEFYEDDFLKNNDKTENIFLLGSSELTHPSEAIPYHFISNRFDVKVKGVGHAGNQCLSILSQLLAKQEIINQAPIVIILSPSWFESKATKGTPSAIFLEFNSNRFLHQMIQNNTSNFYSDYLFKRVSDLYQEFNSPNLELRLMFNKYQASKSVLHQLLYKPVIMADEQLMELRNMINPFHSLTHQKFKRNTIMPKDITINWDSLFTKSRNQILNNASNNTMGIANEIYPEFEHKKGHVQPVSITFNQELQDMQVLIKFLNENHAQASFIISPLNPYYFKNLPALNPTIQQIELCLKTNGFKYLNLFESDSTKYDKALLFDVMHLSDFGWYKIDQFIINNYHLANAK